RMAGAGRNFVRPAPMRGRPLVVAAAAEERERAFALPPAAAVAALVVVVIVVVVAGAALATAVRAVLVAVVAAAAAAVAGAVPSLVVVVEIVVVAVRRAALVFVAVARAVIVRVVVAAEESAEDAADAALAGRATVAAALLAVALEHLEELVEHEETSSRPTLPHREMTARSHRREGLAARPARVGARTDGLAPGGRVVTPLVGLRISHAAPRGGGIRYARHEVELGFPPPLVHAVRLADADVAHRRAAGDLLRAGDDDAHGRGAGPPVRRALGAARRLPGLHRGLPAEPGLRGVAVRRRRQHALGGGLGAGGGHRADRAADRAGDDV